MFALKKLFQAREKMAERRSRWDDVEKPFLDHLEDLRKLLMKASITLVVTMVLCFFFNQQLLEIIRYPVRLAGLESIDGSRLPPQWPRENWGRTKELARAASTVSGPEKEAFLRQVPPELLDGVKATGLFRAALVLPPDRREAFVSEAAAAGSVRELALYLVRHNPSAEIDKSGELLRMTALGPPETFALTMKLAFFAGIVISFPLLLWYMAEFIVPGLTRKERKLLLPSVAVGFGLFLGGVLFSYFVVIPRALQFFHQFSLGLAVIDDWRIGYYVSFVTQVTLIFGVCFELPVVVMALVKLGILSYTKMKGSRAYGTLAIFMVAAFITPTTDALTLMLLAGPMLVLYEISIWLAFLVERKEKKREQEEKREWKERRLRPTVEGTASATAAEAPPPPDGGGEVVPAPQPAPAAVPRTDDDALPPEWGHESDPYQDPYGLDPWNPQPEDEAPKPTDDDNEGTAKDP